MDRQKRYVEAIGQFNKVIAREPANPQAYDCVALDLDPMSQIERADAAYQRALKVNQGPQRFVPRLQLRPLSDEA